MAKPTEVKLTKKQQKDVLRMYNKETKTAQKIAEALSIPRFQVMYFLETSGLKSYSDASYGVSY